VLVNHFRAFHGVPHRFSLFEALHKAQFQKYLGYSLVIVLSSHFEESKDLNKIIGEEVSLII